MVPSPVVQPATLSEANNQEPLGPTSSEVEVDAQVKADCLAALSQPVVMPSIEDNL